MPAEAKPLFHPAALKAAMKAFALPPAAVAARAKVQQWGAQLAAKKLDGKKETELLPGFIQDVFEAALGYTRPPSDPYTLKRESLIEVDGKFADAGLGRFSTKGDTFVVVLEGKGPKDPLDRPFGSRKYSAVMQAVTYALQLKIDWYLVTNLKETRLYYKRQDTAHYERFETTKLAESDDEYARFVFLLGAERVVGADGKNHLDALLTESRAVGRELTADYYREYRELRRKTFQALADHNPDKPAAKLLAATQKVLDRVLFVAFCEDRELLPAQIVARAYQHTDAFNPRPVWDNFKALFRAVDVGNPALNVDAYNGGLFAPDAFIDALLVPDAVCEGFKKLADYEYGHDTANTAKLIDVEILGHIFEQSISDLEEMQRQLSKSGTLPEPVGPTKRKKEGAFYTPAFITRYIVRETLGPVLGDKFEALRAQQHATATGSAPRVLVNPQAYNLDALNEPQTRALLDFWEAWVEELQTVRVVDPSCGSGAFLIEAFDQLFAQYREANARLTELRGGQPTLFDADETILTKNLFGMDLNGEAVQIARLSCWIKTAARGKKLTALDTNIVQGNSVVADGAPLEAWQARFPDVFASGGFDAVIGNPPYVRQEWFAADKPELAKWFESFDSIADLFTYFYELGVKLLRLGGRLGYITSGSWVRGNFGSGLRGFLSKNAALESMIDFGEFQPFEDAEMIRPTIAVLAKRPPGQPMRLWKLLTSGKPPENLSDVIRTAPLMNTQHLSADAWELESDEVIALRRVLAARGKRLAEYVGGEIYRGVLTGLTEVFVIDAERRAQLIKDDSRSAELIKPFVQGTHLRPWHIEESGEFLLAIKSSDNFTWPWSQSGNDAEAVFAQTYPAIHSYLNQHRTAAVKRTDQGRFWWELRSCGYWPAFEAEKIAWPDIGNYPRFSLDKGKRYLGNTGYVIPRADYFLLGVLSSWATWFYLSKTAQPLRLRSDRWQYRLFTQYMENIPVPDAPDADKKAIGDLAERCGTLATERYKLETAVRHRLAQGFGVDAGGKSLGKLNEKASDWWEVSLTELGAALKTSFKLPGNPFANPKTADTWEPYLNEKRNEAATLRSQLAAAEAEINARVYQLFQLTPGEIKLLQCEVEH